jgi:hypothetical protein
MDKTQNKGYPLETVEETPNARLVELGLKEHTAKKNAYSSKDPWRMARTYCMHKGVSNGVIEAMGYTPMMNMVRARS